MPDPRVGQRVFPLGRLITRMIAGHKPYTEPKPPDSPVMWFDTYCERCLKSPLWGRWVGTNVRGWF